MFSFFLFTNFTTLGKHVLLRLFLTWRLTRALIITTRKLLRYVRMFLFMLMIDKWNFKSMKVKALIINKDNSKNSIWNNSICARIWPLSYLYYTKTAPTALGAMVIVRWIPIYIAEGQREQSKEQICWQFACKFYFLNQ